MKWAETVQLRLILLLHFRNIESYHFIKNVMKNLEFKPYSRASSVISRESWRLGTVPAINIVEAVNRATNHQEQKRNSTDKNGTTANGKTGENAEAKLQLNGLSPTMDEMNLNEDSNRESIPGTVVYEQYPWVLRRKFMTTLGLYEIVEKYNFKSILMLIA